MSNLFEDSRDGPKVNEIQRENFTERSRMIRQEEFQKRRVNEGQSNTMCGRSPWTTRGRQ